MFDRKFFNSLSEGDFGTGFLVRQSLVEGDFWTAQDGLYAFYRGVGNVNRIDWEAMVHVTYAAGPTVVPAHVPHDPDSETYYGLRRVSETGKEEKGTQAIVKLVLDDQGLRLPDLPNPVTDLQVRQISHDTIRICWNYWPLDQDSLPDHFELYGDNGTGQIDFTSELERIDCTEVFTYDIDHLINPSMGRHRFAVRTIDVAGNSDGSTDFVDIEIKPAAQTQLANIEGKVSL
jgi:hypothetical protein